MATATKSKTGFNVPCPHCGATNTEDSADGLTVNVGNLVMTCRSCDEEVTAQRPASDGRRRPTADPLARLGRDGLTGRAALAGAHLPCRSFRPGGPAGKRSWPDGCRQHTHRAGGKAPP